MDDQYENYRPGILFQHYQQQQKEQRGQQLQLPEIRPDKYVKCFS